MLDADFVSVKAKIYINKFLRRKKNERHYEKVP